ncbi:hypothetical protein I316_00705 [Kwoniella heveanensis BCC8398]|uniref:Armadillo repeat-containing protein 8 n=1 Tax=Kwoniella heveanensis BCC8398 TaxID=1296120 RepID=A0A1B9H2T3_9TREE|nr:hypothetical protein I316_00705 [Kwoniella heveanensis BCC8398]
MTTAGTLSRLTAASSRTDQLKVLKDLKNSVIGNTWKKVEVAEDEALLSFLLSFLQLRPPSEGDFSTSYDLISETAVIVGALANVGNLTLRPLLAVSSPSILLHLILSLAADSSTDSTISAKQLDRLLISLLRALRNLLVSTADMVWGHMWGVGAERQVVGTGLIGVDVMSEKDMRKGKCPAGKSRGWRRDANEALTMVFEPTNLSTLLRLLNTQDDPQILLPVYQILSRLVVLPSHREALAQRVMPTPTLVRSFYEQSESERSEMDSSMSGATTSLGTFAQSQPEPFKISNILYRISSRSRRYEGMYSEKPNPRLVEAGLDLLAALVRGHPRLADLVRTGNEPVDNEGRENEWWSDMGFGSQLQEMVESGPITVRIAAASCLTNILKADKSSKPTERIGLTVISLKLLEEVIKLLQTESLEERMRLCFILAALVADDAALQKNAAERCCPTLIVGMLHSINQDEAKGELGNDLASRSREATMLALASLAMQYEPTRSLIADYSPSVFPHLLSGLSSPSYGVRAASCQLARALSRAISVLRTSLVDSGVGEEIIKLLQAETDRRKKEEEAGFDEGGDDIGTRTWTVEVACTAVICNMIADFSPLKAILVKENALQLISELTKSPHEPLALNALWALKNLTFHAMESTKALVTSTLGWDRLRSLLTAPTPQGLRIQAFEITQNLLAEASSSEISRTVEALGEKDLLDLVTEAARDKEDIELRIPALYVLSNLALGNEKVRAAIVSRIEILEVLSEALNSKTDALKVPSLRTMRHLIESNAKTHRPRSGMIELFQPYQLKTRLRELAEGSVSLDVCQAAVGLLDVLDRERGVGGGSGGGVSSGGR